MANRPGPDNGTENTDPEDPADERDAKPTAQEATGTPASGGNKRAPEADTTTTTTAPEQSNTPDSGGNKRAPEPATQASSAPQGDEGAFQEAQDITRDTVSRGDTSPDGVETGDGDVSEQARDFEQEVIESTPGVSSRDQVTIRQDEDTLRAELTDSGQLGARRAMRRRIRERTNTITTGLGFEGTRNNRRAPDAPDRQTRIEARAKNRQRDTFEGLGIEGTQDDGRQLPDAAGSPTFRERKQQSQLRDSFEGLGIEGTQDDGYTLPDDAGSSTFRERKQQSQLRDSFEGLGIEGTDGDRRGPQAGLSKQEREVRAKIQDAEEDAETGSFTLSVAGNDLFTVEGQAQDVEPVYNDDGSVSFEQRERASISEDIDWSFGLGDPDTDEVETTFESVNEYFAEKAAGISDRTTAETDGIQVGTTKGLFSESLIAEGLEAAGYEAEADALEATGQKFVRGSVEGVASIPAIATSVPLAGMELTETAVTGGKRTLAGEGDEFLSDLGDAAGGALGQAASTAAANPVGSAGVLAGSLVGTAGVFRGARAIGPRTSIATRYAIQPGEELLGRGGFAATKKLRGEATAQKFFPNKEPLIFSEEAAIRAGKRGAAKLRKAANADSLQAFRRSERAQAELTGLTRNTETVTELEDTESLSEIEDAAEQRRAQLRYKTNRRLEQRREREPDREPPEPTTVSRRDFDTVTQRDVRTVSRGPDTSRSGPTARQKAAQRAQVTDTSGLNLSPREKQLAAQLETPESDLRTWAGQLQGAEARLEAAQQPQVRFNDEFSGTAAKETALGGFDATLAETAALDSTLARDTAFGQVEQTDVYRDTDTEIGVDTDTATDVFSETATEADTRLDIQTEIEPVFEFEQEQEQEQVFEFEQEQELEQESELEQEFELELELEQEQEVEATLFDRDDELTDRGLRSGIFAQNIENPWATPGQALFGQRFFDGGGGDAQ